MTRLRFTVLGPPDLRSGNGEPVESVLRQPRLVAILAYLATGVRARRSRDELLGLLWADVMITRARHSLSQSMYELRRELGADTFTTRGTVDVGLNEAIVSSDVREFQRCVRENDHATAVDLWAGEFLAGFQLPDASVEFEQWVDGERTRQRRAVIEAALALAGAADSAGITSDAVRWSKWAAEITPLDEAVARRTIEAMSRHGDTIGAVLYYRDFESRLAREAQLAVSPALAELVRRIESAPPPRSPVVTAGPLAPRGAAESSRGVEEPAPGTSSPAGAAVAHDTRSNDRAGTSTAHVRGRTRAARAVRMLRLPALVTAGFAGAAVLGSLWYSQAGKRGTSDAVTLRAKRIAVAPFDNRTGDPALDPVGFMAADWIIRETIASGLAEVVSYTETVQSALHAADTAGMAYEERSRAFALAKASALLLRGAYYRTGGDSVVFQADVIDVASSRIARTIGPVGVSRAGIAAGMETLSERVAGTMSALLDQRMAQWTGHSSQPSSLDAYRKFNDGMDAFMRYATSPQSPERPVIIRRSIQRFHAAFVADSTFTVALIWEYFARLQECTLGPILQELERRRPGMPPWDRAMADYAISFECGGKDERAALRAAKRALEYAPDSEWAYKVAFTAARFLQYDEAKAALLSIDPGKGWMAGWPSYWSLLAQLHHALGEYDEELRTVLKMNEFFPQNAHERLDLLPRALLALGRTDEALDTVRAGLDPESGGTFPPDVLWALEAEFRLHAPDRFDEVADLIYTAWLRRGAAMLSNILIEGGPESVSTSGSDADLAVFQTERSRFLLAWYTARVFGESHPEVTLKLTEEALDAATVPEDSLRALSTRANALAWAGRRDELRQTIVEMEGFRRVSYLEPVMPYLMSMMHGSAGNQDSALWYFRQVVSRKEAFIRYAAHPWPLSYLLKDYEPFREFVARR